MSQVKENPTEKAGKLEIVEPSVLSVKEVNGRTRDMYFETMSMINPDILLDAVDQSFLGEAIRDAVDAIDFDNVIRDMEIDLAFEKNQLIYNVLKNYFVNGRISVLDSAEETAKFNEAMESVFKVALAKSNPDEAEYAGILTAEEIDEVFKKTGPYMRGGRGGNFMNGRQQRDMINPMDPYNRRNMDPRDQYGRGGYDPRGARGGYGAYDQRGGYGARGGYDQRGGYGAYDQRGGYGARGGYDRGGYGSRGGYDQYDQRGGYGARGGYGYQNARGGRFGR